MSLEFLKDFDALLGMIVTFGVIYKLYLMPAKQREDKQNERLKDIEKEQALQAQRLDSGDRKFTEVCESIKAMREDINDLKIQVAKTNTLLEKAVFRGVGENA